MGIAYARSDDPLDCFGLNRINETGKSFPSYLSKLSSSCYNVFQEKSICHMDPHS